MIRFHRPIVSVLSVALLALAVCMAVPGAAGAAEDGQDKAAHPRPNSPDRSKNLDFLFGALKAAPDADSAKAVETRIMTLWQASGSDTADLLMSRAKKAVDGKDLDLALELLDGIVEIRPQYTEAWNRRATINFMKKDYIAAIQDLRQVLAREPRHFAALIGLGMILQEIDEDKMALTVLRRALELHPHLPRVPEQVKALEEKVEGRGI
jgi:tetratricopeptide (TPR) repeat protein